MPWQDYSENLEWHYNPQLATPGAREPAELARSTLSAQARAELQMQSDLRYGPEVRQTLDLFPAREPGPAIHVYLHGGYWRRGDKSASSFVAGPAVRRGISTVVMNYGLCPEYSLEEVTRQALDGIVWIYRHAASLGAARPRLFLSGHSAGAHLCAMALAYDWREMAIEDDFICGAALISGVFDLEPVVHVSVNEQVRLTAERAVALSPQRKPPLKPVPLIFSLGGREARGWHAQTEDYAALCRRAGCPVQSIQFPDDDHYSITVAAHGRDDSPVVAAMASVIGRG